MQTCAIIIVPYNYFIFFLLGYLLFYKRDKNVSLRNRSLYHIHMYPHTPPPTYIYTTYIHKYPHTHVPTPIHTYPHTPPNIYTTYIHINPHTLVPTYSCRCIYYLSALYLLVLLAVHVCNLFITDHYKSIIA